jgi:hypothetical protein
MGVPTSEVDYTPAMLRREDCEEEIYLIQQCLIDGILNGSSYQEEGL